MNYTLSPATTSTYRLGAVHTTREHGPRSRACKPSLSHRCRWNIY